MNMHNVFGISLSLPTDLQGVSNLNRLSINQKSFNYAVM